MSVEAVQMSEDVGSKPDWGCDVELSVKFLSRDRGR